MSIRWRRAGVAAPRRSGRPAGATLVAAVFFLAAVLVAACAPAATGAPSAPSTGQPTSPLEGVVTNVVSAGLDKVTAFTIRIAGGALVTFTVGDLENGDEFPPGHLTEHAAISEPIRVHFTVEGDNLVVTRLEDAGG